MNISSIKDSINDYVVKPVYNHVAKPAYKYGVKPVGKVGYEAFSLPGTLLAGIFIGIGVAHDRLSPESETVIKEVGGMIFQNRGTAAAAIIGFALLGGGLISLITGGVTLAPILFFGGVSLVLGSMGYLLLTSNS